MKIKKIAACAAAAALAVSAMAVNAFALTTENYFKADSNNTVFVNADKAEDPTWAVDAGVDQTTIYGVTYYVEFNADEVADEETWIGGGIGANSNSTGWKQAAEWGKDKEIAPDFENGTVTWLSDEPIFAADDAYAQFWLQTWGGTVTVTGADILGEGGTVLSTADSAAPAEDSAPAEEAAPAADGETDSGKTGNVAVASIAGVMALAGVAAVVSRKRK